MNPAVKEINESMLTITTSGEKAFALSDIRAFVDSFPYHRSGVITADADFDPSLGYIRGYFFSFKDDTCVVQVRKSSLSVSLLDNEVVPFELRGKLKEFWLRHRELVPFEPIRELQARRILAFSSPAGHPSRQPSWAPNIGTRICQWHGIRVEEKPDYLTHISIFIDLEKTVVDVAVSYALGGVDLADATLWADLKELQGFLGERVAVVLEAEGLAVELDKQD